MLNGLGSLIENFKNACEQKNKANDIYTAIIENIFAFRWWSAFSDDNTIMILKRDKDSDLQKEDSIF